MFLYQATLSSPQSVREGGVAIGSFSGTSKVQEIAVAAGGASLELLRVDPASGRLIVVLVTAVFGLIRSIAPFRLTGASKGISIDSIQPPNHIPTHPLPEQRYQRNLTITITLYHLTMHQTADYLVVSSDSGRVVVLEYNPAKNIFDKVHQETFGKSGYRRVIPGQFLATDPKGRAICIGAVEKQKLVYIMNRNSSNQLTISSPLEAHKPQTICFHIVGVDVGYENPIFAAIELDFTESDQDPSGEAFDAIEKVVTYYELDLGLNHVVRKWSDTVDRTANMLIAVPGGAEGPSGVLVCSENYISWRHPDHLEVRMMIPARVDPLHSVAAAAEGGLDGTRSGVIIVHGVVHKLKKSFFILLQTEDGDIFKVTLDYSLGADKSIGGVTNIRLKYFDTIPVASGMVLFKNGLLFVASEFGNHYLYRVDSLGDDDEDQPEYESSLIPPEADMVVFRPRALRNLTVVDELDSLMPLIDSKVVNLRDEDSPQIYTLCGRGARSSFRMLRHGLEATEVAVSSLPGNPNAVWTVKLNAKDEFDSYIVVSFVNATLVLSIGEIVEERTDTGFLDSTMTLAVGQLGDDALVQVYPQGIRHIRADRRVSEWKSPSNKWIVRAACNQKQVVVALSSNELVYFELDGSGQLNEYQDRKETSAHVLSLSIGPIPDGRQRSKYLAVGCADNTVRIISLDPDNCLGSLAVQALSSAAESLCLIEMNDTGTHVGTTYLNIGMENGVLLRSTLDTVTGTLSDTRMRFLGPRAPKLFKIKLQGQPALLALSSRPWLSYTLQSRTKLIPLCYETLEYGSSFCSDQCPEGIVSIAGNTLRILLVEKLGSVFNQSVVSLKYTPRRFELHPPTNTFVVIESDHRTYCPSEKRKIMEERSNDMDDGEFQELPPEQFGLPRAEAGKWGSCVRLINPLSMESTSVIDLDDNEAAFSIAMCTFPYTLPGETIAVVGGGQNVKLTPRSCKRGFLRAYKIVNDGAELEFMHMTPLEDIPNALCAFQGRMLVGMGKVLRIYDIGKRKFLRKCEAKIFPNVITAIHTQGNRIVVTDVQESVHYAVFLPSENRITVFADDTTNGWKTCSTMLDYDTVVSGDKFGNLSVARLSSEVSQEIDDDPSGNKLLLEKGFLQGAPHKLEHLAEFHVGETITSIHKTSLVAGGREVILYTTFLGRIGILIPFVSKEDVDFFQSLEMHVRAASPPLCGRDHIAFRGAYVPVRNVIDGDLCEMFNAIPIEKRRGIAEDLDRNVGEMAKKLEDLRNRVAF
ncbi:Splicing factor 3B subunit 3 [Physocladia obscura]|uniref:Splicing factor 3B subunit 3 n=1 Tax=Physocladia obscura TaxID=109957 RepID=A0AAD5XHZ3_9FUNG|nr:Splicing factor 3B subunit 3 [Physocladia obscura]